MPRQHRRKTTRWINEDCMQLAVRDICDGIETPSTAARKYGLKRTTIIYRVEKKQKMDLIKRGEGKQTESIPTPLMAEIFSVTQEKELMGYLNRYTYLPYDTSGSYKAARQLVYQFVKEHDIKHPKMWDIEQQAGVDWLKGFILRNPGTNLRNSTKPPAKNKKNKIEDWAKGANSKATNKKKVNKIESIEPPAIELSRVKKQSQPVALSEQSLESNNSFANSYLSYMDGSNPPQLQDSQLPNQNSDFSDALDMNENSVLDLEPECHITMANVKDEPADELTENTTQDTNFDEHKAHIIPNLDTVPENDDVFNSFGRNIAFQAKELFQHNQVDALELMHEVQTLVNRRLINMLRLNRGSNNYRNNPAKRARRLFNGDDDNHCDN